ncbi:MAG: anthranilate phosphoribosyltransferase [Candidatus Omnitrophica bacterium]|nr:anthranilate phosphoribosyltransferase [Candidatus Omnitrophota bacterium]
MIKEAIDKLAKRIDLNGEETAQVFEEIMTGAATPIQIAAFITALRMKGETVSEISAAARVMRNKAARVTLSEQVDIIDTCGTGGDVSNTFNISTATALVVAGCGIKVAKHGNRCVSSQCGSADVLEELGVKIDLPPERVKQCIEKIGIGFMFAPVFHGAMKFASEPRKQIGIRTIFNILGPLSNPAGANYQIIGVYRPELTETMAKVLAALGAAGAMVVHSHDGLDEISISAKTKITELRNKKIRTYYVQPTNFGLRRAPISFIKGGTRQENAAIIMDILNSKKGPKRDVVLMNASAALMVMEEARNFKEGVRIAAEAIDSRRALEKLELLRLEK